MATSPKGDTLNHSPTSQNDSKNGPHDYKCQSMIATIEKKALVLEVQLDDDDLEIYGFVGNEHAIIESKHEVPFDFGPFYKKRVNAISEDSRGLKMINKIRGSIHTIGVFIFKPLIGLL